MGKKRKASARAATREPTEDTQFEPTRKRIRTFEDVADSEDEFHINQDRLLLDESAEAKRARRQAERDAFLQPSDEEVLNSDDEADDYDDFSETSPPDPKQSAYTRKLGWKDGHNPEEDSLGRGNSEDEEEDEEEEEQEAWGTSRADFYGADVIETEEQALEEEAEALRLQKKHLRLMSAKDYGFDETEWQATSDTVGKNAIVKETLSELPIQEGLSEGERLKILNTRYPELEPMRKELLALQDLLDKLSNEIRQIDKEPALSKPNLCVKYQTLSAYLGAIAMYFALLTSGATDNSAQLLMPATQLRSHDIMAVLVECRSVWQNAKELPEDTVQPLPQNVALKSQQSQVDTASSHSLNKTVAKQTRKQRHEAAINDAKAARIAERLKRTEAGFADLDTLLQHNTSSRPSKRSGRANDEADVGEEAHLTASQAEEKARKRKSLRFYTSQIAQKTNKRNSAGRNAGGDDDVPHRERLRDRQARLNAEAEKRGQKRSGLGDDLGGASDDDDAQQARNIRQQLDDEDGYYDMVAAKTAKKKADKAALVAAQRQAEAEGGRVVEEETVGADGKRKITYAIEKNKGLTPHRHKDVRNPRVKKRKKFEQKSKKLATMKPVYKGGEGRGGYGGELTGIKSNLVRSVKL